MTIELIALIFVLGILVGLILGVTLARPSINYR